MSTKDENQMNLKEKFEELSRIVNEDFGGDFGRGVTVRYDENPEANDRSYIDPNGAYNKADAEFEIGYMDFKVIVSMFDKQDKCLVLKEFSVWGDDRTYIEDIDYKAFEIKDFMDPTIHLRAKDNRNGLWDSWEEWAVSMEPLCLKIVASINGAPEGLPGALRNSHLVRGVIAAASTSGVRRNPINLPKLPSSVGRMRRNRKVSVRAALASPP